MKLCDFRFVENELPPIDVNVLGYWEGEPQAFTVIRWTGNHWRSDEDDSYTSPTRWHFLPGGRELNDMNFIGTPKIDWIVSET